MVTTSWDDVVARIDRTDHRPTRSIDAALARAVDSLARFPVHSDPRERRRAAGCALREALAVYRLAGGGPAYLDNLARLLERTPPGDAVAGPVGDRARLARARLELHANRAVNTDDEDELAGIDERLDDVNARAAALERPGRRTAPGDVVVHAVDVTTP